MYKIYYIIFLILFVSFLSLPPLLFGLKLWKDNLPWIVILLILTLGGWCLVNGIVYFYYEYLHLYIEYHPDPPQYLVDELVSDGAKRVFALLFGWLYGPIYSMPWFIIYRIGVYTMDKINSQEEDEVKKLFN